VRELRQVLALPSLKISVTCIQAPVFFGDSFSVTLQSASAVDLAKVNAALEDAPGIELVEAGDYPTAVGDAGAGRRVRWSGSQRYRRPVGT